jgi:hypothetical protein
MAVLVTLELVDRGARRAVGQVRGVALRRLPRGVSRERHDRRQRDAGVREPRAVAVSQIV